MKIEKDSLKSLDILITGSTKEWKSFTILEGHLKYDDEGELHTSARGEGVNSPNGLGNKIIINLIEKLLNCKGS